MSPEKNEQTAELSELDLKKLIKHLDKKQSNRLASNKVLTHAVSILSGPAIATGVAYIMGISAKPLINNPAGELSRVFSENQGALLPSSLMLMAYGLLKHTQNHLKDAYGQAIEKALSSSPHAYYRDAVRQLNTPEANGSLVDQLKKGRALWELSADFPTMTRPKRNGDIPNVSLTRAFPKLHDPHITKTEMILGFLPFTKTLTDGINSLRSPKKFFDKKQRGSVDLTHLAALLGNDDSEIGKLIKSSQHIQNDPDVQRVFKNSDAVLRALSSNTKGLRATLNAYFEAIGPAAQSFFKDPNNLGSCLKEWDQLLGDVYAFEIEYGSKMTLRQKATETIADLNRELQSTSPSRGKLASISKELKAFAALQQGKSLSDMAKMSRLCAEISQSIDHTLTSPQYGTRYDALRLPDGKLPMVSEQAQQLLSVSIPEQHTLDENEVQPNWSLLDEAYLSIHKKLHRAEDPYPKPGVTQEAAFNMMLGKIKNHLQYNITNKHLEQGQTPPAADELEQTIDELMLGWSQRAVYALANRHSDVGLRESMTEPAFKKRPTPTPPTSSHAPAHNEGRMNPSRKPS